MRMPDILDAAENKRIELPSVQRTFVWKAHQIENLWDSLLRGYPIGALVVAKTTGATMNLLDGQQRVTSICLPFYDDKKDKPLFRTSSSQLRLFLDLGRGFGSSDARKFCFRVATRSHPWGYDRENNEKKLKADAIARWISRFAIEDPLSENVLRDHYPEDAVCPVPFSLFARGVRENWGEAAVTDAVLQWLKKQGLEETYIQGVKEKAVYTIEEIHASVASCYKNFQLPVLEIKLPSVESGGDETASAEQRAGDDARPAFTDDDRDEIETLFLRLNSAGTPISGEELNYSLLKSALSSSKTFNGLTKKIEKDCAGIMRPARFISISFRLFQNTRPTAGSAAGDTVQLRIKPARFKQLMKKENEKSAYLKWLKKILVKKSYEGMTLLEYVKTLLLYQHSLCYEQNKDFRLPYSLFSSLFDSAPELGFILLYRIIRDNGDRFLDDEKCHRAMLGSLLLFFWLCKGASRKYANLLNHVWPYVRLELPQAEFWSYPLLARGEQLMPAIPPNGQCFREIAEIDYHTNSNFYTKVEGKAKEYAEYYRTLLWEKGLVLYAQRHFLAHWYPPETLMLDDRSIPFDWDHILPAQKGRVHNVAQCLKEVFNSIGNLRAWPYELNRSDQDRTPAEKFDFSTLNDRLKKTFATKIFGNDDNEGLTPRKLKRIREYTIHSSFLHEGWTKCRCETLNVTGDKDGWKEYMWLILSRVADIENEFRNNLMAGLNIRPLKDMRIESLLDRRRWKLYGNRNDIFCARLSNDIHFYFMNTSDLVLQAGIYASTADNKTLLQETANIAAAELSREEYDKKIWVYKDFELPAYSAMAYSHAIQTAVMPLFCPLVERIGEDALKRFRELMDTVGPDKAQSDLAMNVSGPCG